jgi:putative phage-type endonuclease
MMDQRTEEWFQARLGKVTASCIAKVMAKLKSGEPSADRMNYAAQLITERLTGVKADTFTNAAMQWGVDTEDQARAAYEFKHGAAVVETGFIDHPRIAKSGASPDGLVGDVGLVEIKCPNTATHLTTLDGGGIERKYLLQMQWQMACCDRAWCDFASFDPRLPLPMQLHVERIHRDDELIAEIEAEVSAFINELDQREAALRARYLEKEAA